jgi:hypothetical protein
MKRASPGGGTAAALAFGLAWAAVVSCRTAPPPPPAAPYALASADDAFLEDLSRRSFRYFAEQADPGTGLVRDRARAREDTPPAPGADADVASIAATGFGLTGLCIAAQRGWLEPAEARARALAALRFLAERAPHERGWFYHWLDARTGQRRWQSEVSSIDTALLLAGVLSVRQCFREDVEIGRLARHLYERVDFPWMLAGDPGLLSMGWKPETGFLDSRWDGHYEQPLLVLLGIGSPTHPLAPASWLAWPRVWVEYAGYRYVAGAAPLFVHQYSQAWVDFRGRRDRGPPGVDYFANSVAATRAHRRFCIGLARRFPGYSEDLWGITASDSARGYVAWGGPPAHPEIDGSVVPCAAAGSLMFTPDIALPALRHMRERFGKDVYARYGFADAFNPATGWIGPDVIGIDLGITLLSAENLRSESVWRWFMANEEMPRAMDRAGLLRR